MGGRAAAYLRTSSAANVDGDSAHRQNAAVMAYAARAGLAVVVCFWDAAVSGADPVETRTGFAAMIDHGARDGLTTILVEDASRFARSVIAQELGVMRLASRGIRVVTASGQDLTDSSDPAKVMFRQIAGAFAQYEKAKLVERLRHGRERVRATRGKCEGRRSHVEIAPEAVALARRLHRRNPRTGERRSLRAIAGELAAAGFVSRAGTPYGASAIKAMVDGLRS
jgi:DNA invertase Pin-like site-specific DNA recombinase